jgi:pantoate--beta-alanine ligase
MKTVNTIAELSFARAELSNPVGLVPTMGYLHAGHLSLVKRAIEECSSAIVSIFVNPTQFGPREDLQSYPRDLKRDLELLEGEGVDLVWIPDQLVMYPPGFQTWVTVEDITSRLEGEMRPGHFRGVATVVAKLFNATAPHKAYFGQKDAQQAAAIRQMTADLNFPIQIVVCPTVREPDGLAMSSRNIYLGEEERKQAPALYRALIAAKDAYEGGERSGEVLRQVMRRVLSKSSLARTQYVSCANPDTLLELVRVEERALLSLAVFFGDTRLIDNLLLPPKESN